MRILANVGLCILAFGIVGESLPNPTPSVGKIWPKPQMELTEETFVTVDPATFRFNITSLSCDILRNATDRYIQTMFHQQKKTNRNGLGAKLELSNVKLESVSIILMSHCEELPHLNMDEHYEIKIDSPDRRGEGSIIAPQIWGILRGLESFSQLLVPHGAGYKINSTQIMDFPRFTYRGFMIDTSRHYLPLSYILETLDLMAMNKFNVLHWHIVDSPSFPYQSEVYPDLSAKGAWTNRHIYTLADVATVVNYSIERGIRVLPEFDTPGHTDSWGLGQPGLLTECCDGSGQPDGTYGPVDPSNMANYPFLTNLFKEVTQHFPDHYLHLGGDEVPFDCWKSSPKINKFMEQEGISAGDYAGLEGYYITKLLKLVTDLPTKNGYLVWQEVFDNGVQLAKDTVVHVWKDRYDMNLVKQELANVTAAGFQTLLSSCWYLNDIQYGVDWYRYYECDPHNFEGSAEQKARIIGGEACMWGEYVDKTNLISRTWPRASAVAERLWSDATATASTDEAEPRIEEHRCRMLTRGYDAQPMWPSYCNADIVE